MILVDTSVLVGYWRSPTDKLKRSLSDSQVTICGPVRAELLHGGRDDEDLKKLHAFLEAFTYMEIGLETWTELGLNLHRLRLQGITVPFPDALLATLAIQYSCEVWSYDAHFPLMQKALPGLLLFNESA